MAHQKIWNFNDQLNFIFNALVVEFGIGSAKSKLRDLVGQEFVQDFFTDDGFTYDSNLADFVPVEAFPNASFAAKFYDSLNGTWGDGVLAATPVGSPAIVDNFLKLDGAKHVSFAGLDNADKLTITSQGTVRFKIKALYDGVPATDQVFVSVGKSGGNVNAAFLTHKPAGQCWLYLYDDSGSLLVGGNAGALSLVQGEETKLAFSWDTVTVKRMWYHKNGIFAGQSGTLAAGSRDDDIDLARVGSNIAASLTADFEIRDVLLEDKYIAAPLVDYDPAYTVSDINRLSASFKQVSKIPENATFGAKFNENINGNWGNGVLVATQVGDPQIVDEKLDLAHNDLRYIDFDAENNADAIQVGALKTEFIPNYNGANATEQAIITVARAHNDARNLIYLRHRLGNVSGNYLVLHLHDKDGVLIKEQILNFWIAVLGQKYKFEINYDLTAGATRVFMNGDQIGPTITETGVRDSNIGLLRLGSNCNAQYTSNFSFKNFIYFSAVQHVANYVSEYTVPTKEYLKSNIELPVMSYPLSVGSIQQFVDFVATFSGNPKWVLNGLYHNTVVWTTSDLSASQSNTAAEIIANFSTLPAADDLYVVIVLPDDVVQAEVSNLEIGYTGQENQDVSGTVEPNEGQLCDGIIELVEDVVKPTGTDVKYYVKRGVEELYFDGASFVATDKTDGQLNTLAEIFANKALLDLSDNPKTIKIVPKLIPNDLGIPEVKTISMKYNYYKALDLPNECKVSGYLMGLNNIGVEDGTEVRFWAKKPFKNGANALYTYDRTALTVTKDGRKGWFEIYLVETETIEKTIIATVPYIGEESGTVLYKDYKNLTIPDEAEADFNTIIGNI